MWVWLIHLLLAAVCAAAVRNDTRLILLQIRLLLEMSAHSDCMLLEANNRVGCAYSMQMTIMQRKGQTNMHLVHDHNMVILKDYIKRDVLHISTKLLSKLHEAEFQALLDIKICINIRQGASLGMCTCIFGV